MYIIKKVSLSRLRIIAVVCFFVFEITQSFSQNVGQWRGVNRDGKYNETNLLKVWKDTVPELLWFTEVIGNGYGSPSILNERVFVNGETDSISYLFAFDLKGKLLWKSPNGKEFVGKDFSGGFPGARSTPTIVDKLAYACSGRGRIACYEVSNGAEKWAVDMINDFGGRENEFGYSESLVTDAKNVYCFPGGATTNIVAINRFTGKTVWESNAMVDSTSFCSPILIKLPERNIFVTCSRHLIFAMDCKNGELLWSYPLQGLKNDGDHYNTPTYIDGHIYLVSEEKEGKGTVNFELSPDGKSVKEIWSNKQVRNKFGGFVIVENNLFTTIDKNYLKSIDLNNGNVVDSMKTRLGSLIFSDNKFICYGNNGEVSLIKYEQKKLEVASKFRIEKGSKEHLAHPVLADGIMYIRHGKALMAYKIK